MSERQESPNKSKIKTYKRELSIILLVVLLLFFCYGLVNPVSLDIAKHLTIYVFTFAGGSFGLDAFSKQINKG